MAKGPEEFVLVTRARLKNSRRWIVHAYGPYTQAKAKRLKQEAYAEAQSKGYELTASACRMINIERMNDEMAPSPKVPSRPGEDRALHRKDHGTD